ncbi:MAG: hypothetical protein DMG06_25760 [Acidobacteria bacterium]|nr:MAG: hypothetical protein DMG06_25760 [Acidobacteriota bacterium]
MKKLISKQLFVAKAFLDLVALFVLFTSPLAAQEVSVLESEAMTIIAKRCLSCHNAEMKPADLVLTTRETAVKGGKSGPALSPKHPEESLMVRKIFADEMPPGNPLTKEEREAVRGWIDAGAPWSMTLAKASAVRPRAGLNWWSLQPLRTVSVPSPAGIPPDWSASPVDRFVYAQLKEKGLKPSPPADRRTYIRRATFDLLGLPPTPEEVESFLQDKSENACEKLIDRLLASPYYGERWGRHWLDVIRFGESHGYEQNHLRERAWPFRDYIIRSFNLDKPFSRLVLEQLAGDQIAPNDPEIEVATGFLVAGVHDTVPIANLEGQLQQRANDLDDMVLTTGAAFLGLTVNCARCHDHKFDPILQADYYRVQAAFAGVHHEERELATQAERDQRHSRERPILDELDRVKERLAKLKKQVMPLVEKGRDEIAKHYRPAVDSKVNEEIFSPASARLVRMTILATYDQGPGKGAEMATHLGRE